MDKQNGHVAAKFCATHLDEVRLGHQPLLLVFDFVSATVPFEDALRYTLDAAKLPFLGETYDDDAFHKAFSLPSKLTFVRAKPRVESDTDWWRDVY